MAKYRCIDRDRCQLAKDGVILNIPDGVQTVAQCPLKNENPECFHHLFPVGGGNRLDFLPILLGILAIAVLSFGGYGIYQWATTTSVSTTPVPGSDVVGENPKLEKEEIKIAETQAEPTPQLQNLQTQLEEKNANIVDLNTELENQKAEINDLNKKIETQAKLVSQLQNLQAQLEEKNASIVALNTELEKQKAEIDDLNKKIKTQAELNLQLQNVQTQLEEKNASIVALNTELEKQLENQKAEINDLNKKIETQKEQDDLVKQKEFLSNFNVDFEYLDEDSQSNILVDGASLTSASSYRVIVKNKQKAYISVLQKDHSENECHLLNRDNLVIELEPGTHYVPTDGIRYFLFPNDTSNGKKTLFVQAVQNTESLPALKECPTQHDCDTCIAAVDFHFEK